MSHLGRVKTEADKFKYTLQPIAVRLSALLGQEVKFVPATSGIIVETAVNELKNGEVLLLENTRFEDLVGLKESGNDETLGRYWASLGDIFINDAFGTAHRAHASNVGIATYLPSGIGFLVRKEIMYLNKIMRKPERPLVVILGGAKVKDKIGVITSLVKFADYLLIGGAMSFTFFKALGYDVGSSVVDDESIDFCKEIYKQYPNKIILPTDIVLGTAYTPATATRLAKIDNIGSNEIGLDIGVQTINSFRQILSEAKTIIWNGPLGVVEIDKFALGTRKIGELLTTLRATTIISGGDTAAAMSKFKFDHKFSYISTGGGATLKLLEGEPLPGITAISAK